MKDKKMYLDNLVYIVMPAYNEGRVIAEVIKGIPSELELEGVHCKVVVCVVDDGSSDDTYNESVESGAIVLRHQINMGAGAATRTGVDFAVRQGAKYIATIDSDGQHSIEDLNKLLGELITSNRRFVIGSRLKDTDQMPAHKVFGNKLLSLFTNILFGVSVTDSQSGLRGFDRQTATTLTWKSDGYGFCSEMIWRARQTKIEITEVGISSIYTDYSKSKGQSSWNAFNIVKEMFRHRFGGTLK